MRRRMAGFFAIFVMLFHTSAYAIPEEVVAVGKAVGIEVKCSGLVVVGFSEDSGARDSGLRQGDRIVMVDGERVSEVETLRAMLQEKSQVTVTALRNDREQSFLVPLREEDGVRRMGVNVKSEMTGIGTITYYDPETGKYGALGHGITDGTELFPVEEGIICKATILRVAPGKPGAPGMLQGAFDLDERIGTVEKNTPCGIFGTMIQCPEGKLMPVGTEESVETGAAVILCNVDGERVAEYAVEITAIHPAEDATGRNMMLRVTDERLLRRTGGIVQGVSGSPIIQNGQIIGAVTHVLVADPSRGYGIFIENMLDAAA